MAIPGEKPHTVEDILSLPKDVRAELIDGQIHYQTAHTERHIEITAHIFALLFWHAFQIGTCEVYTAPFAVYQNKDSADYFVPDVTVVCDRTKADSYHCFGAPDFVIEVVSPDTKEVDKSVKLSKYQAAGVREYWVVDADCNMIQVHRFESGEYKEYTFQDTVPVGIFEDYSIDFTAFQKYLDN